jgi:PKD repeat protein
VAKHVKYALQVSLLILSCAIASFAQVPQVQHVLVVLEENTDYADVCGPNNTSMPFLCGLKSKGSFSANYYAPTHPSIGNYTDLGWGVVSTNDDGCDPTTCGFPYAGNNIVRASAAAGKSWKGYAESLPRNCYFGGDSGSYAVRHSPIPYISDVQSNCGNRYVAFEDANVGFAHDVANNTLPNFAFITPNLCDDGHDCTLPGSPVPDQWLRNNVLQPLMNAGHLDPATGDTVVIVLFDESNADDTNGGGAVYWFMIGKGVKQNYQSAGPKGAPGFYSHESSLRVVAELVGASITGLGGAATAPDMAEFFGATTNSPPPVAVLAVTPQIGTAPLQVTADSSGSSSLNGSIASRLIDFGDGTTSAAATASHTYKAAGTFTVTLSVTNNLNLTSTASDTVTVQTAPQPISVAVSPTTATVSSGGTRQFTAAVTNSTNQGVTWKATAGTISNTGLFTAPRVSTNTTITVTASSVAVPSKTANATVTVQPSAPQVIAVAVTPTTATVSSGGTRQFTAAVTNSTNQGVTWKATAGTISNAGLFTAPVVSNNTMVTVTASSAVAPSQVAVGTVTVQAPAVPVVVQTVQHNSGFTGSASSVAVNFKNSVTAGHVLLVAQSTFDGETLLAPVDSQGNAFTQAVTAASPGAAVAAIYIATANHMGQDTVTCRIGSGASDNIHCHIYEINGTTSVVDALGSAVQNRAASVSTSQATTNSNDYVFAYFGDNVSESTYIAGPGLGNIEQSQSPSQDSGFSGDKLVSTTGIQTMSATASTDDPLVGLIVALKNSQTTVIPPTAPNCSLSVSPTSGPIPLAVNASATCTDPQNNLISTVLTWGDGSSTNGSSGSHTYVNAGSFAVRVTATDSSNLTGSATQTVVASSLLPPPSVSVTVTPASAIVSSNGAQLFVATVANSSNQAVTWTATAGTISAGLFTAPLVSTKTTVIVTANSVAVPSQSASVTVQVLAAATSPSSLTPSGPINLTGQNGTVVENLHITNPSGDCVVISNSTNIIIQKSEIGPCGGHGVKISGGNTIGIYDNYIHPEKPLATDCCDTHDGVFADKTSNLSIQGNVIAYGESNIEVNNATVVTVRGNFLLNPIDSDPSQPADGQSRGQNFQAWSNSSNITVEDNYALSSTDKSKYLFAENQEDAINFGITNGVVVKGNYITGGHSPSGCGLIADDRANNVQFLSNTLLDTGQCGIGIAGGTNQLVDNNRVLNRTPLPGAGNTAIYVWNQYSACGPATVSNNVATEIRSDGTQSGFWNGGGCEPVTLTKNTFDSAAQTLLGSPSQTMPPPKIPPVPKECVVTSPFTNNTNLPSCHTK